MPTSFEALHDETRPLALLDPAPRRGSIVGGLVVLALLLAVPLAIVILL